MDRLKEVCNNCGLTFGSHCAERYYSKVYLKKIPYNSCPGHQGRMDWNEGPGTIFEPTGLYKDAVYGEAAKGVKDD